MGILLFSCNDDLLEKESTSKMSAKVVFGSEETIEAVRMGMYANLASSRYPKLYTTDLPLLGGILGNDMVYGKQWYSILNSAYTYRVDSESGEPASLWSHLWYFAEIANTIDTEITEEIAKENPFKAQVKAEAKAMRGMVITDVARFFGKAYSLDNGASKSIPYVKTLQYQVDKPGVVEKPFRNTMKEIYELAIKDIEEALPNLANWSSNRNVMNKNAAYAVLSRLYLDMHDYQKAKDYAEKSMQGVSLMAAKELYRGDLSRENSETIFCFTGNKNNYGKYRAITSFFDNYDGMGDDYLVNLSLVKLFKDTDIRKNFFTVEKDGYFGTGYKYWENYQKYPEIGFQIATTANPNGSYAYGKMPRKDSSITNKVRGTLGLGDYNYIRGSEMVLTIAECAARLGNNAEAQDKLYEIQARADKTAVKSTKTGEDLIAEILVERRKELFGEGHAYRDILRLGKGLKRDGSHSIKLDLKADDPRFVWPIPRSAVDKNENLTK